MPHVALATSPDTGLVIATCLPALIRIEQPQKGASRVLIPTPSLNHYPRACVANGIPVVITQMNIAGTDMAVVYNTLGKSAILGPAFASNPVAIRALGNDVVTYGCYGDHYWIRLLDARTLSPLGGPTEHTIPIGVTSDGIRDVTSDGILSWLQTTKLSANPEVALLLWLQRGNWLVGQDASTPANRYLAYDTSTRKVYTLPGSFAPYMPSVVGPDHDGVIWVGLSDVDGTVTYHNDTGWKEIPAPGRPVPVPVPSPAPEPIPKPETPEPMPDHNTTIPNPFALTTAIPSREVAGVEAFPVITRLRAARLANDTLTADIDLAPFPSLPLGPEQSQVIGNHMWVIFHKGQWHVAPGEWLRPGQLAKSVPIFSELINGGHFASDRFAPLDTWNLGYEEVVGFFIATPVRTGVMSATTVRGRSNIVWLNRQGTTLEMVGEEMWSDTSPTVPPGEPTLPQEPTSPPSPTNPTTVDLTPLLGALEDLRRDFVEKLEEIHKDLALTIGQGRKVSLKVWGQPVSGTIDPLPPR